MYIHHNIKAQRTLRSHPKYFVFPLDCVKKMRVGRLKSNLWGEVILAFQATHHALPHLQAAHWKMMKSIDTWPLAPMK